MEDNKEDLDIFDAMLNGEYNATLDNEEVESTTAEEVTQEEDTDQEAEPEVEEQPDETGDGEPDEESETEDKDEEEDTLVDDDGSEKEDPVEVEADEAEIEEETTDEDSTDTEEEADVAETETTDTIDYKKFYEDVTATEFVVNGKKTKGFTDPKKIIQSQQMAGGYANKMAGFKQYRPYMNPLKDRGMLDDPAKFNLAMSLIDGDKEALKHHMETLGINPVMDLDMEAIKYEGQNALSSDTQIVLDDAMEMARANGVGDKFSNVIAKEWDQSSFEELMVKGEAREHLVTHLSDGTYDMVQGRIKELESIDVNGTFGAMTSINKYRNAYEQLRQEQQQVTDAANQQAQTQESRKVEEASKAARIKAEKAKIAKARKDEEYKAKAAEQTAKVAKQRDKATSVSKKKPKVKPKPTFDPLKLEGEDLDAYMTKLMAGGR